MKKLFFISALFIYTFFFPQAAKAQLLSLDAIEGIPDTVVDNQLVGLSALVTKAGGIAFTGDLTLFIHALNDTSDADTLFHNPNYVLSANTFSDTLEMTYVFLATNLDAGDNIVVVWPSSSMIPQEVEGDSLVFNVYLKNVGIDENKHRQTVMLYPNPARSEVRLRLGFPEKVEQVRVLDVLGKEILWFGEAVKSFNVESLVDGIYFVEVKSRDGGVVVKKFFRH